MKDSEINIFLNNLTKLQWACRRGMLELDVLLGNFLNEAYPGLSDDNKKRFVRLLGYPDPELLTWLMGSEIPEDQDLAIITDLIRQHARSRF
jgi:antitoxin CptB